jgi:phage terminase large subunit-like protein
VPKRLEGLDYTLAILDEAGRIDRDVFEVVTLATGNQRTSVALAIGTPGPELDQTVLGGLRQYVAEHPEDPLTVWREWSAAGFEHHPVDCEHCWELANPALDDFLARDGLAATPPPKMRESALRRLCQFVDQREEAWLPLGAWAACSDTTRSIPDGADVVLGFDGSFSRDCTALLAATVDQRPHVELVELWEAPEGSRDWRVPVVAVEDAIRAACARWRVVEVAADPYRWQRSLEVLDGDGVPVHEFFQTAARMGPATARFYQLVVDGELTHDGGSALARHVANAILREDSRGARLSKEAKDSPRRIDGAVATVMAVHRAAELAGVSRPDIYI